MMTCFKGKMSRSIQVVAAALAVGMPVASTAWAEGERIVLIYHDDDTETWWNTAKNAATLAAEQVGVEIEFRNPPTGDIADMARIIQQTTATQPDGILTTIADYNMLKAPIEDAIAQGIPVITINSGTIEQSQEMGALLHIGQPEYEAGKRAGERAKSEGVTDFVCVNDYISNSASVERCQGFADGLGIELASRMIDSGTDVREIANKVSAYLTANSSTDAVLSLSSTSAAGATLALQENGQLGEMYFASFDLSEAILNAVKEGSMAFAIDQQPFLQGYMPVEIMANYLRYGVFPSSSILSGPNFITKDNAEQVISMAGKWR